MIEDSVWDEVEESEMAELSANVPDEDELSQRLTVVLEADPVEIAQAVVAAMEARDEAELLAAGGELVVPAPEDIVVIKEVVQSILSFFQEDDHDVLTDIRADVSGIREYLENQEQLGTSLHPMMTTRFADYTVTEGLLLLILLLLVIQACVRMLKGGFSWLKW